MYVFATEYARRHVFNAFWFTHNFYILLYFFLVLHGIGRLVQDPIWGYFFIGPLVVFVFDKLVSISRNKVEIAVKTAKMLPSGKDIYILIIYLFIYYYYYKKILLLIFFFFFFFFNYYYILFYFFNYYCKKIFYLNMELSAHIDQNFKYFTNKTSHTMNCRSYLP